MDEKKRDEVWYLEAARSASSIFPEGPIPLDNERPDFLFQTSTGTLGIELTLLRREEPLAESARLAKVTPRAEALYLERPDVRPLVVRPVFHITDAPLMKVSTLARSLADFAYHHRHDGGSFEWDEVPPGFYYIGVHPASDGVNSWVWLRPGDTVVAPHDFVLKRIEAKNRLLPAYRQRASEVWLLLVTDGYWGVGEVYVRPEDLAAWTFESGFDKLLLFYRPLGEPGSVTELHQPPN